MQADCGLEARAAGDGGERGNAAVHWTEVPDFDPYLRYHLRGNDVARIPFWNVSASRPYPDLATVAAGGALAAGAAAVASELLDLDVLKELSVTQAATRAAASGSSSSRDWRDRS